MIHEKKNNFSKHFLSSYSLPLPARYVVNTLAQIRLKQVPAPACPPAPSKGLSGVKRGRGCLFFDLDEVSASTAV